MRKRFVSILIAASIIAIFPCVCSGDDLEDLKAAHMQTVKALSTGDIDLWLATSHEQQVRFETNDPFPVDYKEIDKATLRRDGQALMAGFEKYLVTPVLMQYRVIGTTGIVWGYVRNAVKLKGGSETTNYIRFTGIYAKSGGKWLRVCTHNSEIPWGK